MSGFCMHIRNVFTIIGDLFLHMHTNIYTHLYGTFAVKFNPAKFNPCENESP